MNRRRAHAEVPLQVSFSGRPSEHVRVCIDEGQILPLLGRKVWHIRRRRHRGFLDWSLSRLAVWESRTD
jgi:hypothetical protein